MLRRDIVAVLLAGIALSPSAVGETPEHLTPAASIESGGDFEEFEGYNWAARVHAQHVIVDALALSTTIQADASRTAIDAEFTGLMPTLGRGYLLVGANVTRLGFTDQGGTVVFFDLPRDIPSWTLFDASKLDPYTTLIVLPAEPSSSSSESNKRNAGEVGYKPPPQPRSSDFLGEAWVTEHVLGLYTNDATIVYDACRRHSIEVMPYIYGARATAAGSVGLSHQRTRDDCFGYDAAKGVPVMLRAKRAFRKETFDDGSYRVYAFGEPSEYLVAPFEQRIALEGHSDIITVELTPAANRWFQRFTESKSTSIVFKGTMGAQVAGVGLDVKLGIREGTTSTTIEITHPNSSRTHKYGVYLWGGKNEHDGVIAMVIRLR